MRFMSCSLTDYFLQPPLSEKVVVNWHGCHTALNFDVKAKEDKTRLHRYTGYLKSIHKPYKARLIANSSSCTTT